MHTSTQEQKLNPPAKNAKSKNENFGPRKNRTDATHKTPTPTIDDALFNAQNDKTNAQRNTDEKPPPKSTWRPRPAKLENRLSRCGTGFVRNKAHKSRGRRTGHRNQATIRPQLDALSAKTARQGGGLPSDYLAAEREWRDAVGASKWMARQAVG